jgi:DNA repair exonuclease SbcCD ATPase subunit
MLSLKKLRVRGFRGIRDTVEFDLDQSAVLLFGENHCGKSSTLNAIEWGLFGDACIGNQTGIRERIDWQVANLHMADPDVLVEMELADANGPFTLRRSVKRSGRKVAADLELARPDGRKVTGAQAEKTLARLLGSTFRDFMTMVYQHQEAIRAVLTQTPKDRNDAIDRLLGLSDYRNLVQTIQNANAGGWHRRIAERFSAFDEKIGAALAVRESTLAERHRDAEAAGIAADQLNENGAVDVAGRVRDALTAFAAEAGITVALTEVPQATQQLEDFEKTVRVHITRLRSELPDLRHQQELFMRQGEASGLKSELEKAKEVVDGINGSIRELDATHGSAQAVTKRVSEIQAEADQLRDALRERSALASLLREALAYLEKAGKAPAKCPVCSASASDLAKSLRQKSQKSLGADITKTEQQIRKLEESVAALEEAAARYKEASAKLARHAEVVGQIRERAGKLLGRTLTERDSALALLTAEVGSISGRLEELKGAVHAKQVRLDAIVQHVDRLHLIREIVGLEEKKQRVERIRETPEYRELVALRDHAAELVSDLDCIKAAVSTVAHTQAKQKLAAAEAKIDGFFRKLTRHPAVTRLRLTVTADTRYNRNSYDLTDQDGKDLTPILSQGDLNSLALAMFLGLACSAEGSGGFSFLMMDDPSQSLGSEHKEQLVGVLNEVATSRRLLIATMDREFRDFWREGVKHPKTEYWFDGWTLTGGPSIIRR